MYPTLLYRENLKLIQKIKFVQALSESDFEVDIPPTELPKFELLSKKFSVPLIVGTVSGFDITPFIRFSHSEPLTSIGNLTRPLIFAHAITDYCRLLWKPKRNNHYVFTGLITPQRREAITTWAELALSQKHVNLPDGNTRIPHQLIKKPIKHTGFAKLVFHLLGERKND